MYYTHTLIQEYHLQRHNYPPSRRYHPHLSNQQGQEHSHGELSEHGDEGNSGRGSHLDKTIKPFTTCVCISHHKIEQRTHSRYAMGEEVH